MEKLIQEFLNKLENKEVKLLTWGLVDGGFTEDELEELAEDYLREKDAEIDPGEFLDILIEKRRLLFELNIRGNYLFRTRMGEGVRLFARLRQLFPNNNNWQTAPTLVADYRLQIRPRLYPKRYIKTNQIKQLLTEENLLNSLSEKALEAILSNGLKKDFQLAEFQVRATIQMLKDLSDSISRGMIVCAGTGTGKTLAFYLPTLIHISCLIEGEKYWTKTLAIYPRNELLKDQFSQTYQEARSLDNLLKKQGKRKVIIGAFFGLTPNRVDGENIQQKWGKAINSQYICPYLVCPKCQGNLGWKTDDIAKNKERLFCTNSSCKTEIKEDEVILTRERMAKQPPDLVFTTTEMLNRSMADLKYGRVFGIGVKETPPLVLLDEVHTYTGIHGAQVAYLLRRWQKIIGNKVQFTGLSATLENAVDFFSQLVGLSSEVISNISPRDDLIAEGMEYQLILRGDPASGTSLLSTTIQTAMLLRRILDNQNSVSSGFYGDRVFAFTDDLDVTNRLYHNLLDAEGRDSWNRPLRNRQPLAILRHHTAEKLVSGQSWFLATEIGHNLGNPLVIGRTSSQDAGVNQQADIIVATASLEVGFNDPQVGAVIQHKAPIDMASFLQRKGRAGRSRKMRPWTVVILSDYGRDRLAYLGYDTLFNPTLAKKNLPLSNRYVMRIQAVYSFMDWVAQKIASNMSFGSVWHDFSQPLLSNSDYWQQQAQRRQQAEIKLIEEVLETETRRKELENHLKSSLGLAGEDLQTILWDSPRSLMLAVLPTLLRRLESGWQRWQSHKEGEPEGVYYTKQTVSLFDRDYYIPFLPLPDFIPANLFSDLLLPEVAVMTPTQIQSAEADINQMPVFQALKTFAPGRVSRRFGIEHIFATHWIAPSSLNDHEVALRDRTQTMNVEQFCPEFEEYGLFQRWENGQIVDIPCIRPWTINTTQVPNNIAITSNAQLEWCSQICPADVGFKLQLPTNFPWVFFIEDIICFTHNHQSPVEVRRMAIASHANIRFENGIEFNTNIYFSQGEENRRVSLGFTQSVDALMFRIRIPEEFKISRDDTNQAKIRSLRSAYFRHCILTDDRLDDLANNFQRDWLFQIYLSMLTNHALTSGQNLEQTWRELSSQNITPMMIEVLDNIFQSLNIEESLLPENEVNYGNNQESSRNLGNNNNTNNNQHPRIYQRLTALCDNPEIQTVLNQLAPVLWLEPDANFNQWAKQRLKSTIGSALLSACGQLCPHFDTFDLILDIEPSPRIDHILPLESNTEEIWITESTVGGGGNIEEIARRYNEDPHKFFQLAISALQPSDLEIIDTELTKLLELTNTDELVKEAYSISCAEGIAQIRLAEKYQELKLAHENLRQVLINKDLFITPSVMTAINARILRPGSNEETDRLLRQLITLWRQEEERLGIEIDSRVFAYHRSEDNSLDHALQNLGLSQTNSYWRFQVIYGLLWKRGNIIRSSSLFSYNPFTPLPEPDRELLLDILPNNEVEIHLSDSQWYEKLKKVYKKGNSVQLIAKNELIQQLKITLLELMAKPMEIDFLLVYPQIEAVQKSNTQTIVKLRFRAISQ